MKNILLIASSGPGMLGVGGLLIRDMLRTEGVDPVALAAILPESDASTLDPSPLRALRTFPAPREYIDRAPGGWAATLAAWRARRAGYDRDIARIARDLKAFLHEQKPDLVWVILNSLSSIDSTYLLLDAIPGDLLVQVWDDPRHLALQRRLDRLSRDRTWRRAQAIFARARQIAVIGESMATAYGELAQCPIHIVRHGSIETPVEPAPLPAQPGEFRIGFAGSLYAQSAWRALLATLDHLDWRLHQTPVTLLALGGRIEFTSRSPHARARYLGWQSPRQTLDHLRACDLLYLPQAFESSHATLTRLSFPTKLSACLATGRPVFIHTPPHGSLTAFCHSMGYTLLSHHLHPSELAAFLEAQTTPRNLADHARRAADLGNRVFTRRNFENQVRDMLGISHPPADAP
ncbi:MAG TPA: hypothetical protein PKE55_02225 [Kiritimatiellia bacterium]|nr:hypothetical protein [Kiritimatiellia bacterium]